MPAGNGLPSGDQALEQSCARRQEMMENHWIPPHRATAADWTCKTVTKSLVDCLVPDRQNTVRLRVAFWGDLKCLPAKTLPCVVC